MRIHTRSYYLLYWKTWNLSTVIRYKTPFTTNGRAITLDFAICKDVLVKSIMGFPTITEFQFELKCRPYPHISTSILEQVFKIEFRKAACGHMIDHNETPTKLSVALPFDESNKNQDPVRPSSLSHSVMSLILMNSWMKYKFRSDGLSAFISIAGCRVRSPWEETESNLGRWRE